MVRASLVRSSSSNGDVEGDMDDRGAGSSVGPDCDSVTDGKSSLGTLLSGAGKGWPAIFGACSGWGM